jgi:RNA polymerase sigma-70 factor (ECF subfamily)
MSAPTAHASSFQAGEAEARAHAAMNFFMDRYAQGHEAAFAALYDALAPRLQGYLLRQTRDHAWAEDLLQQTFLHMHCARGRFIAGAEVLPWAFAIARRVFIDDVRRRGRRRSRDRSIAAEERSRLSPRPDEFLYSKQLASTVARELTRLPRSQQEVFELLKVEGLSLAEAAVVLGTSITAVKLRAHRTYQALRACAEAPAPGTAPAS